MICRSSASSGFAARREAVLQPLRQESAVDGAVRQRQGIESTGFAQGHVGYGGTAGAREDFAAVLVVESRRSSD